MIDPKDTPELACGYIRSSTNSQTITGSAQRQRIEKYFKQLGFASVGIPGDTAVTSKKLFAKRQGGSKIMSLVQSGAAKHIVICKMDRAFRNVVECLQTVEIWNKQGASLHVLDFNGAILTTGDSMGRLILTIMAAVGEWERAVIAERTQIASMFAQANGKCMSSRPPYGKKIVGTLGLRDEQGRKTAMLEDVPEELEVIQYIMNLRSEGLKPNTIAKRLMKEGVLNRGRRSWDYGMIYRIICRAQGIPWRKKG